MVTKLTEGQKYTLQVIAVEDKYGVKSTEFNRSPTVTFTTTDPKVESRHEGKGYKTLYFSETQRKSYISF